MKTQQARLVQTGLALGVLLALVIAPQTRWLVRLQALTVLRLYHPFPSSSDQSYTLTHADDAKRIRGVVASRPGDFGLQYAAAVNCDDTTQVVAPLRALEPRFPDKAALYAGILRRAVDGLHWNRTEENTLYNLPSPPQEFHPVPNAPAALAAFDRDAAAGERLDPDNAYFPIMRATGLFAARRDSEALAAVKRAGKEHQWREYVPEEIEARWRLHQEAFGDPGAFPRSVIAYTTPFPQYARLRALARLLLFKAVQQERAGHPEEGFKIREELRRYGDLMRVQSTSLISSMVGIAIAAIATGNPGGAMPPKNDPGLKLERPGTTPEQMAQRRIDAYCAYVGRIGHPEAAAKVRAEEEDRRKITALASSPTLLDLPVPIFRLAAWWLADLAALSNAGWLLLLGVLAAGLGRRRQTGPLPPGTAGGVGAALALGLLGIALGVMNPADRLAQNLLYYVAVFVLLPGGVLLIVSVLHPPLRRPLGAGVLACLLTLAALGSLAALTLWQSRGLSDLLTAVRTLTSYSGDDASSGDGDGVGQATERALRAACAALAVAVPLLLLLASVITARIRRVPASVGVVQGFRSAALPLACLILLAWGGLLLGTLRQEGVVNTQTWHSAHDEGLYLAAQAGQTWPGPVR